ncbi:MAG TPA: hypothetical protein VKQ52_21520 [Puia sp.]|nr:hypothetical protein [Puia sp.]
MITRIEAEEEDLSILHLRRGFPEAFQVFVFEYYAELFSFSLLLVNDRSSARKITSEAFFLLWARRTEFDTAKKIKAFLYLAVRNRCMLQVRSAD